MSMNLPEYRESWWERLLFSVLAVVIYGPLIGVVVVSGVTVAEQYPPLESPLEFVAHALTTASALFIILGVVFGLVVWIVFPRRD